MIEKILPFAMHYWPFILALLITMILIAFNELLGQKGKAMALSAKEAVQTINHQSAHIFDIRSIEEFKKAHILHAIHATEQDLSKSSFERYKTHPIIILCQRGTRAHQFANLAKNQGFQSVYVLTGGIQAWLEAELPVVKD